VLDFYEKNNVHFCLTKCFFHFIHSFIHMFRSLRVLSSLFDCEYVLRHLRFERKFSAALLSRCYVCLQIISVRARISRRSHLLGTAEQRMRSTAISVTRKPWEKSRAAENVCGCCNCMVRSGPRCRNRLAFVCSGNNATMQFPDDVSDWSAQAKLVKITPRTRFFLSMPRLFRAVKYEHL